MGRAPCCDKNGLKKGPWTPEEDQKLIDYIKKHGYGNWRTLPKNAGLQRCGKSCRLRWTNYLRPDIKRGLFTFEEEETIIQLHSILGNKWSAIAARLPRRTDNEIKNYWNTHIRKRLLRMGIDPVTHNPRLDLLDLSSILSTSLYNTSQMNFSRLLGFQPLVNPEILRLANSVMSNQRENQNIVNQNGQKIQLCNPQIQNQCQEVLVQDFNQFQSQPSQQVPACTSLASPCMAFSNETSQILNPNIKHVPTCSSLASPSMAFSNETSQISDPNIVQYQSILSNFISQLQIHDLESQIASNLNEDYLHAPSYYNDHSLYHGNLMDHSTETETFIPQNNFVINNNINSMSDLSTSSSSPTPMNSNSTYINGGSSSITTEDEGNMMKFEIPYDILDVSNFMYYEKPSD